MMKKRRDFFSSLIHRKDSREVFIRPPYYKDISLFESKCSLCNGVCATYCPEGIIVIQENKTPKLDLDTSGCTYCDECADVCEYGVLSIEFKKLIKANIKINILQCLSWNSTMCFSCKDICLDDAVKFLGLFKAEIDYEKCTNCGFCISVCPTNAVEIKGDDGGS